MTFCTRFRPEIIIVATSLLYIAIGGFMNSALNNPADEVNQFIAESLRNRGFALDKNAASWLWSTVIVMFVTGSFVGSAVAHQMADRFGRKPTLMYFSSALYILAAVFFYLAKPLHLFELVIVGRLITGISNGIANPVLATYLVESVPDDLTGFAGSVLDFSGCIGSFLGIALSMDGALGSSALWHHLLGAPCLLVAVLQIFTSVFFYESPKYLLLHRHNPLAAAKAVGFFYGPRVSGEETWKILAGFVDAEKDQGIKGEYLRDDHVHSVKKSRIRRHFKTLALSAALGCLPLVCGYTIMLSYSAEILGMSGMSENSAQTYTSVMAAFEVIGSIGSLAVNYRSPRRLVLLTCTFICLALMIAIVVLLVLNQLYPSMLFVHAVGSVISLVASVNVVGPFPLYLLLPAELAPQKIRALATSVAGAVYYLICILALLLFYPLFGKIGPFSFVPFIVIGMCLFPYLYWSLPETSPRYKLSHHEEMRRNFSVINVRYPDQYLDDSITTRRIRLRSESAPLLHEGSPPQYGSHLSRISSGDSKSSDDSGGIKI